MNPKNTFAAEFPGTLPGTVTMLPPPKSKSNASPPPEPATVVSHVPPNAVLPNGVAQIVEGSGLRKMSAHFAEPSIAPLFVVTSKKVPPSEKSSVTLKFPIAASNAARFVKTVIVWARRPAGSSAATERARMRRVFIHRYS